MLIPLFTDVLYVQQMSDFEFVQYNQNGVSILLPANFKIVSHAPQLYAEAKRGYGTLVLSLDPEEGFRAGCEEMFKRPQGTNPLLDTRVIRESQLWTPYEGRERIIEHRLIDGPDNPDFAWFALFYPLESFLMVEIGAEGTFAESGELWQRVIDSICISDV